MSTDAPQPYDVSVSGRVSAAVRELAAVARGRGDGPVFLDALREFYRRLRIYPQFGDPLIDLKQEEGQIRIGVVLPLVMRYAVYEELRQVFVSALPALLSKAKPPS